MKGEASLRQKNKLIHAHCQQLANYLVAEESAVVAAYKDAVDTIGGLRLVIGPAAVNARACLQRVVAILQPFAVQLKLQLQEPTKEGTKDANGSSAKDEGQVPAGGAGHKQDSKN